MISTANIIKMARKKLLEAGSEIFSDDDLILYANICKDELASRYLGDRLIKSVTLSFLGGEADIPVDYNGAYYVNDTGQKGGTKYDVVGIKEFLRGDLTYMICEDGGKFKNSQNAPTLTMWYYSKLTDMALTPTPVNPPSELKDQLHELIVYGIVYRAFEDAQDFELSKYFKDKFEAEYTIRTSNLSELEEAPKQSAQMFEALPDLNFTGYGAQDPNRW